MTEQKNTYTATDAVYREWLAKVLEVEDEVKELNQTKRDLIKTAETKGCNPKILRQLVRITKMQQADKDSLQDALELA